MRPGQEARGFSWAYRDQLFAMLVAFMALGVLALLATKVKTHTTALWLPPLIVEDRWDPRSNSDVDLWVGAPGDKPVGYSNRYQKTCNLLRDDLGRESDGYSRNLEQVFCRGTPSGRWIVNAMAYGVYNAVMPIWVDATVYRERAGQESVMLHKRVSLTSRGQELTIWRFVLDGDGNLVPGSVDDVHEPLRH